MLVFEKHDGPPSVRQRRRPPPTIMACRLFSFSSVKGEVKRCSTQVAALHSLFSFCSVDDTRLLRPPFSSYFLYSLSPQATRHTIYYSHITSSFLIFLTLFLRLFMFIE